ncbi:unnamed protein product [Nippostrongylus brasiliensis]|uniref:Skp1-related protein n=1 Tax=Nippostrongylus brasiliensis TaxID=27835 RepID=A0A0N4YDW6_NIPBR|nr:unnamed protein product [Nippostrongylus brasiliensis]
MSSCPKKPIIFKFETSDGEQFDVPKDQLQHMLRIRKLVQKKKWKNKLHKPIKFSSIDGPTMKKVLEWCTIFKNEPPRCDVPPKKANGRKNTYLPAWEGGHFMDLDAKTLIDLIHAAKNLKIEGLCEMAVNSLEMLSLNKSVKELQVSFNIEDDNFPDEKRQMRAELSHLCPELFP